MSPAIESPRRSPALVWLSAAVASVLLTLSVSGTLGEWTQAVVRQNGNTAATAGGVVLTLAGPDGAGAATSCASSSSATNDATCSVNLLGANGVARTAMRPGDTQTTVFTLTTGGELTGSTLNVAPGPCTGSTDLCGALLVTLTCVGGQTTVIGPMSLTSFATADRDLLGLPASTTTCTALTLLPLTAPLASRSKTISQDVVWTLTA
jgi:hypothetical protein